MTTVMTAELTAAKDALAEVEYLLDALHLALATPEQLDELEDLVCCLIMDYEQSEWEMDQPRQARVDPAGLAVEAYINDFTPLPDWLLDETYPDWHLSKRGKPLTGAALAARRRKVQSNFMRLWFAGWRPATTL